MVNCRLGRIFTAFSKEISVPTAGGLLPPRRIDGPAESPLLSAPRRGFGPVDPRAGQGSGGRGEIPPTPSPAGSAARGRPAGAERVRTSPRTGKRPQIGPAGFVPPPTLYSVYRPKAAQPDPRPGSPAPGPSQSCHHQAAGPRTRGFRLWLPRPVLTPTGRGGPIPTSPRSAFPALLRGTDLAPLALRF